MGCFNSRPHVRLTRTKGGSMIMSKVKAPEEEDEYDDARLILTPDKNPYVMGHRIRRPVDVKKSFTVKIRGTAGQPDLFARCAYKSLRGRSAAPPHKPNQDSLAVFQLAPRPEVAVFTVFDGHGPYGEYASHFCRLEMHPALLAAPSLKYDMQKALDESIKACHEKFIRVPTSTGVDPLVSGTTVISVAFEGNRIHCANVGDSRAILGSQLPDGSTQIVELSDDHKPQRPDEKARIKKSSAILMTERDVRGLDGASPTDKVYVCREKNGDIIYGVLFTRSVGDKDAHEHLGVSEQPEFRDHDLGPNDRYVVLASDGVWDHMSNQEVMDVCFQKEDPLLACEQITRTSAERWENQDFDHRRDDITVLVIRLDASPDAKADGEEAAPHAADVDAATKAAQVRAQAGAHT